MCFYDLNMMSCGCQKWGHFRQHCAKGYRTGRVCGMKLVMARYQKEGKCKICQKIDTKLRAIRKQEERIKRWRKEGGRPASLQAAEEDIKNLQYEIGVLFISKEDAISIGFTQELSGDPRTVNQRVIADEKHGELRRPQVPVTDVLSAVSTLTEVPVEDSRSTHGSGASIETVGLSTEEVDLSCASSAEILEDLSDVSSVRSMDSIFSSLTVSSMSSVGAGLGLDENLYLLLIRDDLIILYSKILHGTTTKDFEGALRHLLTTLASGLRKEASDKKEKAVAKFLQRRVRNFAHRVAASIGGKTSNCGAKVSGSVDAIGDGEISDAEMNDSGDDDNNNESDIQSLERFILQSKALKDFKASLVGLIQPAREVEQHEMERYDGVELLDESNEYVGIVEMVGERSLVVDLPWNRKVEISWKCSCGTVFEEQIIEYKPGAAQKLADSIDTSASIDIEREAGSEFCSDSSTSDSSRTSNGSCQRTSKGRHSLGVETKDQMIVEDSTSREKKEFILMCRDRGNDTKLYHADVSKTLCDYSSYHVLHAQYYGRLKGFWTWLTLREIFSIEFIKFSLFWTTNVSIDPSDFGKVPAYPSEDYCFTANTNPPVPRTALKHFIENPSHAARQSRHRHRIPKKVRGPLLLDKSLDSLEGYGIYIQERICWKKVFLIEAVFATACIIFAVIWCIKNQGGIQDGFAIAGTGIAYVTILLGASQALAQNHWR